MSPDPFHTTTRVGTFLTLKLITEGDCSVFIGGWSAGRFLLKNGRFNQEGEYTFL